MMTTDQVRVRVTVTVTTGDGRQGRRSSVAEFTRPDKWDTFVNPSSFVAAEAASTYKAAWQEAHRAEAAA